MRRLHLELDNGADWSHSLAENRDVPGGMTALELVRTLASSRALCRHAQIMNVMEGSTRIETANGDYMLRAGMSIALGADRWCRIKPQGRVRIWSIYADEQFLRMQMSWFLPHRERVHSGLHPCEWDGTAIVLTPGTAALRKVEPLWRQMSILNDGTHAPEVAAIHTIELFARWVSGVLPVFLDASMSPQPIRPLWRPIAGRLTRPPSAGHVTKAIDLLRARLAEPWTVNSLANEVAVSRTHLTRLFTAHAGAPPMRFLAEIRLTEFTRLIEETDVPISAAARQVGWVDSRIASARFRRRFGVSPSEFRETPHPAAT